MRKLFALSILVSPFLLLAACGDDDLGVRDGGGAAPGTGGTGSGGIPGTGGGIPGTGGSAVGTGGSAVGTGGSIPGSGGISGSGGILGTGGTSPGSGGRSGLGGTGSGGKSVIDGAVLDSTSGPDTPLDAPPPDAPMDGAALDGDSCQAPAVWRYQQPGCGADAHPVCGSTMEDTCIRHACGCDGEILDGCDYYRKPWRSTGICPGYCLSPQTFDAVAKLGWIPGEVASKGCACNPASDAPACMPTQYRSFLLSCVGGIWTVDQSKDCAQLDAASGG